MAKKLSTKDILKKKLTKEELFDNYFEIAKEVLDSFELVFDVNGVMPQVFGESVNDSSDLEQEEILVTAKARVRTSRAWLSLSYLYDYAVDGIANGYPTDIVIEGGEVVSYLNTENGPSVTNLEEIVAQGDGRFALDDGQAIHLNKLAYLADVDPRTVRNAISAGELIAEKTDIGLFIDNANARKWLSGRRGFKPTVMVEDNIQDLDKITTPLEFSSFLKAQREKLGFNHEEKKLVAFHPDLDTAAMSEIEQGVFRLPINAVFPIADFYQTDRKEFLSCVMRVFFGEQLSMLSKSIADQ